jgi:drug/metabolite transporter (DMT)-like permease
VPRPADLVPRPAAGPSTLAALAVAVVAISSSAPLIAYAAAPALAIAFWRNAFAAVVLAPAVGATRRTELAGLGRRGVLACALAGVALAGHFGTWVPSAKYTSIAAATALVATQPVWQGLIALTQGRRLPRLVWLGIGIAVTGAILATGADFAASGPAFAGDVLALIGGVLAAAYTALGERARQTTSTTTYTTICYGVCALLLLVVCLIGGVHLAGYPAATWLAILALTAGPQLLGHSMFNYALHRVAATTVSVLILLEVPGSALIGWLWLGNLPRRGEVPGLAVLLVGVAVVVLGARGRASLPPASVEADSLEAGQPESGGDGRVRRRR